jgi:hypothetical protein
MTGTCHVPRMCPCARAYHLPYVVDGFRLVVARNRRFGQGAGRTRDNREIGGRPPRNDDPVHGHRVYLPSDRASRRSFYTHSPGHLIAPALVVAWSVMVMVYLRRRRPSSLFAWTPPFACRPPWRAVLRTARGPRQRGQLARHRHVRAAHGPRVVCNGRALRPAVAKSPLAYWVGAWLLPVTI